MSARAWALRGALLVGVGALALFMLLPFVALALRVPSRALFGHLGDPVVLEALRLSLLTSLASTVIIAALGTPLAWLLATRRFRGKKLVEGLIDLPMVLPPTVAGLALLLAFGRMGLAGKALALAGVSLPFTTLGVVAAQVFMAAPFFVAPVRAGFASVDRRLLEVASTLGATESHAFRRVAVPLARPALIAGGAMACARALGEFGATITFAGNLPGITQTMPLGVYIALQSDLEAAIVLSLLLLVMSFGLLMVLRAAPARMLSRFGPDRG
jgi:molybdate transport system permease protein